MPEVGARVVELLSELIGIESVNPAYPGGSRGEAAVADFVEQRCRRLGLDVERRPVLPGRDNVVATLRPMGARRRLILEAHMDTVGLGGAGERALRPEVRDGRVHGRGACDTKGSLAAMLAAVELLLERRREHATEVVLLATVDEEHNFRGVLSYAQSGATAEAAIVGEPTGLRVVVATKGCVRCRISTRGRAAHSSEPERGDNAIVRMAAVLAVLEELKAALRARSHPMVGSPTLSVGRIWGGTGVNIVPDRCTIEIDRRTIPGESPEAALAELDAALGRLDDTDASMIERDDPFVVDWALDTPRDAAVVRAATAACRDVLGSAEVVGVPYGTDASKLSALAGIPSVVFGPGSIAQAHTDDEFVPIAELEQAVQVYARAAVLLAAPS
jgi:acetylornithine deacetylase